jgi:amino acid permease
MGLILTVVLQGILAAFVGETVSELVQIFPAPNALFAYVETFVDEDLGWVAAIAHWYVSHPFYDSCARILTSNKGIALHLLFQHRC